MSVREVAGKEIEFDEEGFMSKPDQWDKDVAEALAAEIGINSLTDRHWAVINFCRSDFQVQGDAPTLRRITKQTDVNTKELYQLFPGGAAKIAAKIDELIRDAEMVVLGQAGGAPPSRTSVNR